MKLAPALTLTLTLALGASGLAAAPPTTVPAGAALRPLDKNAAVLSFLAACWDPKFGAFYAYDHARADGTHGPKAGTYADFWFAAQEWQTVLDALDAGLSAYRPLVGQGFDGFLAHYDPSVNNFNDDLTWWIQGALRAYRLTGEARYLSFAREQFARVWQDWDDDLGGGVWWTRDGKRDQKNVATNAPLAAAAVDLAALTGDAAYLDQAKRLYAWVKTALTDGPRVYDHRSGDGTLVRWDFTYNFGTFIDAAVALHGATHDPAYLNDAKAAADWALANLTESGTLLDEGGGDGAGFKGVFVRGLARLARLDPAYAPALQDNAVQAWNHRRADGLTGTNWAATVVDAPLECLGAAGAVTAVLSAPNPEPSARVVAGSGLYEAENARREDVGSGDRVEHSGRGYVNAFNHAGQALEFSVNVPDDGTYTLTWRYAAGAGAATRSLTVNGATSRAAFPGTPTWDGWATAGQDLPLRRGTNSVRLAFQPGDANYLNLDWLRVQAAPASPAGGTANPARAAGAASPALPRS